MFAELGHARLELGERDRVRPIDISALEDVLHVRQLALREFQEHFGRHVERIVLGAIPSRLLRFGVEVVWLAFGRDHFEPTVGQRLGHPHFVRPLGRSRSPDAVVGRDAESILGTVPQLVDEDRRWRWPRLFLVLLPRRLRRLSVGLGLRSGLR